MVDLSIAGPSDFAMVFFLRSKDSGDASNNGISERLRHGYIYLPRGGTPRTLVAPSEVLFVEQFKGRTIAYCPLDGRGMMGGSFLWSTDSRFAAVYSHPIPIYDRRESRCPADGCHTDREQVGGGRFRCPRCEGVARV